MYKAKTKPEGYLEEKYRVVIDVTLTNYEHHIDKVWCSIDYLEWSTMAEILRGVADLLEKDLD